jgi:hypothetical protein
MISKDTFHSVRSGLLLLALAVPACATDAPAEVQQPLTRLAASAPSNAMGVMSWELHEEGEAMRIIGRGPDAQRTVELVAERDAAKPDELVHVDVVFPERGTFDIARGGKVSGAATTFLTGLGDAVKKDMAEGSVSLTPAPFIEYLQGEGHVEMGWSFFGYNANVDVNNWCGQGTRAYFEAYSSYGSSCWVNRWTTNTPYDCRINLHYGIGGWRTDVCNWMVYTNI